MAPPRRVTIGLGALGLGISIFVLPTISSALTGKRAERNADNLSIQLVRSLTFPSDQKSVQNDETPSGNSPSSKDYARGSTSFAKREPLISTHGKSEAEFVGLRRGS